MKVEAFREHGQRWLECKECGATWNDATGDRTVEGDGTCTARAAEDEARAFMGEP